MPDFVKQFGEWNGTEYVLSSQRQSIITSLLSAGTFFGALLQSELDPRRRFCPPRDGVSDQDVSRRHVMLMPTSPYQRQPRAQVLDHVLVCHGEFVILRNAMWAIEGLEIYGTRMPLQLALASVIAGDVLRRRMCAVVR